MRKVILNFSQTDDQGIFEFESESRELRDNFRNVCISSGLVYRVVNNGIVLSVTDAFTLIVRTSSKRAESAWNFAFEYSDTKTKLLIDSFASEYRKSISGDYTTRQIEAIEIQNRLQEYGFNKRTLTSEQLRDVKKLYSIPHGANFSVPGTGKTTVTLALNVLLSDEMEKMLVICPKSAFQAWDEVIDECFLSATIKERFQRLVGDSATIRLLLDNPSFNRFYINYELAANSSNFKEIKRFMTLHRNRVHLVIDESHRIKAGVGSLRGQLALALANLAGRRDILSGTPMPQGASDIASQADFLYPAHGLGGRIRNGEPPGPVMKNLYVRTRKSELGLKDAKVVEERVDMRPAQAAIYGVLCNDTIAQFNFQGRRNRINDLAKGRVIRLLQTSAYPKSLSPVRHLFPELYDAAVEEGPSRKMERAVDICVENASAGKKTVVWTIFTETLLKLKEMTNELGSEVMFGGNPNASNGDFSSRENALKRFTSDQNCSVLIANPAAASEGFSLHKVCHDAVYVDRTYNAAHYLQSMDRIHRLGLSKDVETKITVIKSNIPKGINPIDFGSIDDSVWRRLQIKVENLSRLLDDKDLLEIAYSEDDALPTDYADLDEEDIVDLIQVLTGRKNES